MGELPGGPISRGESFDFYETSTGTAMCHNAGHDIGCGIDESYLDMFFVERKHQHCCKN